MKKPSTVSTLPAPSLEFSPVLPPGVTVTISGKKRELRVVRTATGEVVHRVDVYDKVDRQVEKVMSGMLNRMDTDRFHIEDSADDK